MNDGPAGYGLGWVRTLATWSTAGITALLPLSCRKATLIAHTPAQPPPSAHLACSRSAQRTAGVSAPLISAISVSPRAMLPPSCSQLASRSAAGGKAMTQHD